MRQTRAVTSALVMLATLCAGCASGPQPMRGSGEYGALTYGGALGPRPWPHRGVDYGRPTGTKIIAAATGDVMAVDVVKGKGQRGISYGNTATILHTGIGHGIATRYAHMDEVYVTDGDIVERGDVIGTVGSSGCGPWGRTCDPHLHFEVLVGSKHVDPLSKIAGCEGAEDTDPDRARPLVYPLRC